MTTDTNGAALPRPAVRLMAWASGLAVAGVYYSQPMLTEIAADLGIARDEVGVVFAAAQLGYGAGLLALVALGDLLARHPAPPRSSLRCSRCFEPTRCGAAAPRWRTGADAVRLGTDRAAAGFAVGWAR